MNLYNHYKFLLNIYLKYSVRLNPITVVGITENILTGNHKYKFLKPSFFIIFIIPSKTFLYLKSPKPY